jgi:sodium/hydrogen antiporter
LIDDPLRFRLETLDDSLQPTIDMLLNLSVFIWYGAVCPWVSFRVNDVIPIYRLIFLGVLILLFRRVPVVLAMHRYIPEIEHFHQAAFVGFFGPIGVSAIFYLYVSLDFLNNVTVDGIPGEAVREDAKRLQEVMRVVIWFLAICSIVVHGLSVPLGKLGYHLPRTMSGAFTPTSEISEVDEPDTPFHLRQHILHTRSLRGGKSLQRRDPNERPQNAIFKVGGSVISPQPAGEIATSNNDEPDRAIKFIGDGSAVQSPVDTPLNAKYGSVEELQTPQENGTLFRRMRSTAGTSSDDAALRSNGRGSGTAPEADENDRDYDPGTIEGKQ